MCLILTKLMTAYQTTFQQQFYRVVKRSTAYTIILVFHFNIQRFNIKMLLTIINFLKDGITFGCFSMSFILQIFCKNILYNLLIFIFFHNLFYHCKYNSYLELLKLKSKKHRVGKYYVEGTGILIIYKY